MRNDKYKFFCPHCFSSGKGNSWSCGKSHQNDYISSKIIRFPPKDSNRAKWKEFVHYVEDLWEYKNSDGDYWNEIRRKVKILKIKKNLE